MPVLDREKVDRLKQILKWHPRGMTISDLATKMDTNRNLVAKYLDMLLISGQVDMQVIGAAKVYFLSHRVPISSMLEFSSDLLIVLDGEQKIVQVNEPLLSLLGEKKDALVGRHLKETDNPFFKAVPLSEPSKNKDTALEQVSEMECTIKGEKHHFRVKQLQTAFEDGNQGITLIIEDISAQVMYRQMLEINEARYRGIVEDQTEFITRFMPDGMLIFVNDAYARYLGKNKEELLGGPHIPHLEAEDILAVRRSIRSLSKENPAVTFECRIHHECGKDRWNLWTVRVLFDDENKPVEYQGIGRDNTEKREAAARINQYIKDMEFLSRKAQEFVDHSPDTDIFYAVGEGLSELLPEAVFVINSYDPVSDSLTVRAVFSENDRKNLTACLGQDMLGFRFSLRTVPEQLRTLSFNALQTGRVIHIEENLYDIFFHQIPPDVCDRIEATLGGKDDYYGIGLFRFGIFFGNVTFALPKGKSVPNPSLIETYIHQASIVLHRRLTGEALKESEARYRGIVDDQTELVTRFLPDWTLTFVNSSVCRFFQKERQELLGCSIISLILKEDHERVIHEIRALNSDNPVQTIEYRVSDPSGNIRWFQWTNRLLSNHGGRGAEYQGVGWDITGQKEAEAKIRQYIADRDFLTQTALGFMNLRDDESLYQYIADQLYTLIPDQIVAVSSINPSEGTVILQSVAGLDKSVFEEFRNLGVFLFGKSFSLDKDPDVEAILKTNYLTPGPALYNLLFREFPEDVCLQLGNRIGFGKSYVMGFVREGTIFGSVIIILRPGQELKNREILELFLNQASIALLHAHARQELKKSEALYRSVIENIQDVFYRSDAAGNLVMASPSWAKMLGYDSLDDCVGYNIAEKFYADPARRKEFLDAVYRDGSVNDYEVVLKCRDGTPLYVSTSSHLYYDDAGSSPGVEGIFRDISERHRASEKIRNHISQMDLFSIKLQEFIELSPDADIFEKIASDLKLLVTDAMISVNSFNNVTGILTCRSCKGDDDRAACTRLLGRNPEDIPFPVDPPVLQILSTGRLHNVTLSLYDMLFRVIPRETCDHIVEAARIGDIYAIGFVRGDTLFGNATIFLHKGAAIPDIQLVETYARAASIALQREIAENALKRSEEIFSSVADNAPVPIAIIGPDATYHYVNKKFIETFGYDLDDFRTGSEWFSLAYPDPEYRKNVIATWKSDVKESGSGIVRPRTFTVRCKDGADREILFRPVTLSDGKECIVYEDVTKTACSGRKFRNCYVDCGNFAGRNYQ